MPHSLVLRCEKHYRHVELDGVEVWRGFSPSSAQMVFTGLQEALRVECEKPDLVTTFAMVNNRTHAQVVLNNVVVYHGFLPNAAGRLHWYLSQVLKL